MTKVNNFQINKQLRQDFKVASYSLGYTSMKACLIKELDRIIENNEEMYKTKPPKDDDLGNFTILLDESYKDKLKAYIEKKQDTRFLRDLIATAMINVVKQTNDNYNIDDIIL